MPSTLNDQRIVTAVAIVAAVVVLWLFRSDLRGLGAVLWPLVVAGAVLEFRGELRGLLPRLQKFGPTGAEFAEISIVAQNMAVPVDEALKAVAPNEVQPSYIQARVAALRPELNEKEPGDQVRREHLLMLRLAEALQANQWYGVWLKIFASQLEALDADVANPLELSPYYERHVERREAALSAEQKQQTPPATFEVWASFLARMRVAIVDGRNGTITDEGRGFLEFATRLGLPRYQGF